jgi:hypothetical protein
MKGLARRNTHVKNESPSTYQSKVIAKVKSFADGRTDRQTDGQTDEQSDYYRAPAIIGALIINLQFMSALSQRCFVPNLKKIGTVAMKR